jgi:hypothetical protein
MPIPSFNINGVLPPYVGTSGPGGDATDMSPYEVSATEVVTTFGTSAERQKILRGWLEHRAALRALGFDKGFQWLDGSFVEKKDPKDLDVVLFSYRPAGVSNANLLAQLLRGNLNVFGRAQVKSSYHLDFFAIDLNSSIEVVVGTSRYFLGLFSHRRLDEVWKGMLQVRLEDDKDDAAAMAVLQSLAPPPAVVTLVVPTTT